MLKQKYFKENVPEDEIKFIYQSLYSDIKQLFTKTPLEFQHENSSNFKLLSFTNKLNLQNAFEDLNSIWNKKEIQSAFELHSDELNLDDYIK
jgi:hypothetical protein